MPFKLFTSKAGASHHDMERLVEELNSPNKQSLYAYGLNKQGQQILRQRLRAVYGLNPERDPLTRGTHAAIVNRAFAQSALEQPSVTVRVKNTEDVSLDVDDIKARQENVKVYYDPKKISPEEIAQILRIKETGQKPAGMTQDAADKLASKASGMVIRAETKQYCLLDETASVLPTPRARVSYFTCFPNLGGAPNSADMAAFVKTFLFSGIKEQALKEKFKAIFRLNQKVAALNHEGFDVVTPNAFLMGLNAAQKQTVQRIFAQALVEVACEPPPEGFVGFFVHENHELFTTALSLEESRLKTPVMVGFGTDASAPQLAAQTIGSDIRVAEAVMGHPLHAIGNGALGDWAAWAKEENDERVMVGDLARMFDPGLNPVVADPKNWIALDMPQLTSAPATKQVGGWTTQLWNAMKKGFSDSEKPAESSKLSVLQAYWQQRGFNITAMSIVPDIADGEKSVLKVTIPDAKQREAFMLHIASVTTRRVPVIIDEENRVILGEGRLAGYFECNRDLLKQGFAKYSGSADHPNGLAVFENIKAELEGAAPGPSSTPGASRA